MFYYPFHTMTTVCVHNCWVHHRRIDLYFSRVSRLSSTSPKCHYPFLCSFMNLFLTSMQTCCFCYQIVFVSLWCICLITQNSYWKILFLFCFLYAQFLPKMGVVFNIFESLDSAEKSWKLWQLTLVSTSVSIHGVLEESRILSNEINGF